MPEQGKGEGEEEGGEEAVLAPLLGPIPLIAIPMIAGLGSEVTPMAVILDDEDPLEPIKVCAKLKIREEWEMELGAIGRKKEGLVL